MFRSLLSDPLFVFRKRGIVRGFSGDLERAEWLYFGV